MAGVPVPDLMRELEKAGSTYLPAYVKLMSSSPITKKELREKMTPGNLLSFLSSLAVTDEQVVATLMYFIVWHKCGAPQCPHFSMLRCQGCHWAHYCDSNCQERSNILLII